MEQEARAQEAWHATRRATGGGQPPEEGENRARAGSRPLGQQQSPAAAEAERAGAKAAVVEGMAVAGVPRAAAGPVDVAHRTGARVDEGCGQQWYDAAVDEAIAEAWADAAKRLGGRQWQQQKAAGVVVVEEEEAEGHGESAGGALLRTPADRGPEDGGHDGGRGGGRDGGAAQDIACTSNI